MRAFLITLVTATLLGPALAALEAAPARNPRTPGLNTVHRQQRKALKRQQRAMKRAMAHHLSAGERRRFNHQLKAERQTLRREQKNESRRIKQSRKSARQSHTTVLSSSP